VGDGKNREVPSLTAARLLSSPLISSPHRDSLWKNCNEFRPERFIEDPKPSPFVFTAFQAGPRICLGQNMAMLGVHLPAFLPDPLPSPLSPASEMKYVLANLLQNFELKLEQPAETVTYHSTLTLPIRGSPPSLLLLLVLSPPRQMASSSL
jgi:hypothetical protein